MAPTSEQMVLSANNIMVGSIEAPEPQDSFGFPGLEPGGDPARVKVF